MADAVLRFVIEVDDKGTATIKEFGDEAEGATKKAESGFSKLGSTLQANSTKLLAASAAIAAVGGVVVKMASDFDTGLREVNTLLNLSEDGFADLKDAVVSIDPALGNTQELTEGLYNTISAGISDPVEAISFLEGAAVAASAGVADLGVSVEAGTKVLQGFSAQGVTSNEVFDKLFTTVALGQTKFGELAGVAGGLAATASNLNIDIDELFGSLAQVTLTAGSTSQAATQLEAVMSSLIVPTDRMSEVLGRLGDGTAESAIANVGFVEVLQEVQKESGGSSLALGELFGRKEAMAGFLSLASNGFQDAADKIDEMGESAGAAQKAFEEQQKSSGAAFERLQNTLERVGIQLGSVILPIVADFADKMAGLAQKFLDLDPSTQKFIVGLGAVAAALTGILGTVGFLIGPLTAVGGALLSAGRAAVGMVAGLNPTVAVLLAVAAATALVTAGIVAYMDSTSKAAAVASNFEQVIVSVRTAINFNKEQLGQWVAELDNTTRAMVRQRAETLLSGTLTDELRTKYENIIAALDEYEAGQETAAVATVDTSVALAQINEAAAAAAGGMATTTTSVTDLDEAMSALGVTTLPTVNEALANFGLVLSEGDVPTSQMVTKLDEMIASYAELDLLTPEVTAAIQEQIIALQEQGATLTAAQIALLPYEQGLLAAAEANRILAEKQAETTARVRDHLNNTDFSKYDEAVGNSQEVSTEFYATLSKTGPPQTGLQKIKSAIFGVGTAAEGTKTQTDSMFGGLLDGIGSVFGFDLSGVLGGFMDKFKGIGGGILDSIGGILGGGGEGGGLGGLISGIFGGAGETGGKGFLSGLGSIFGGGEGGGIGGLFSGGGKEGGSGFLSGISSILGGGGEGGGIGGFFSGLFGGGGGGEGGGGLGGMLSGLLGGLGGGAGGGFLGGLGGILSSAANLIPVIGPFISAFAGPLMKGVSALAGKVWGGLKKIFGGPGEAELEARKIGNSLNDAFRGMLSASQQAEAAAAAVGTANDQWAVSNIAIRDSYLAAGFSAAEAQAATDRLAESVRASPQEAQAAADAVSAVTDSVQAAMTATGLNLEELRNKAINTAASTGVSVAEAFSALAAGTVETLSATTDAAVATTTAAAEAMAATSTTALDTVAATGTETGDIISTSIAEGTAAAAAATESNSAIAQQAIVDLGTTTGTTMQVVVAESEKASATLAANMQAATGQVSTTLKAVGDEAMTTAQRVQASFEGIDISVPVRFDVQDPDLPGGGKGIGEGQEEIPRFATGGFVRRPTLGVIGEAGPEFVVPQDRVGAFVNAMGGGQGGGGGLGPVTININGARDPAATGAAVKTALEGLMRQRARSIGRRRQR